MCFWMQASLLWKAREGRPLWSCWPLIAKITLDWISLVFSPKRPVCGISCATVPGHALFLGFPLQTGAVVSSVPNPRYSRHCHFFKSLMSDLWGLWSHGRKSKRHSAEKKAPSGFYDSRGLCPVYLLLHLQWVLMAVVVDFVRLVPHPCRLCSLGWATWPLALNIHL